MKRIFILIALVMMCAAAWAQRTVTGTVSDAGDGSPIEGAAVVVKGTTIGAFTNAEGRFSLNIPADGQALIFSLAGKETAEVPLGSSNVVNVSLADLTTDEVVVTALGITKSQKAVSYAVQQVGGTELLRANESNLVSALSGKVAGLQVTSSAGTAGASAFFLLRGANTINGNNQPLIVVDGVPMDNSQLRSGDAVASVAFSNRAIDINQNDIENVTVLKGAAATALWGSQAGNGAILITTKRGKAGAQRFGVEYTGSLTISQANQLPELQSKYSQGAGGLYGAPHTGQSASWGALIDTLRYVKPGFAYTAAQDRNGDGVYDWDSNGLIVGQNNPNADPNKRVVPYDRYKFFQTAFSNNHNVAVTASTNTSAIRFSTGFTRDVGIVPNNDFNKINVGLNADTRIWDKFHLSTSINYVNSGGTRIEQGSNVSGVMLGLLRTPATFDNSGGSDDPTDPASYLFPDGRPRAYRGLTANGGRSSAYDNPYWTANQNPLTDQVNRIFGNFTLKYSPFSWMDVTYRPGLDLYSDVRKQYFAIGSATISGASGRILHDLYNVSKFNQDLIVTLRKNFNEMVDLTLNVGNNLRGERFDNIYTQGDGLVIPDYYNMNNASNVLTQESLVRSRNLSYFASLDAQISDWIFLNGSYRLESTTTLAEGNDTYGYYAVGGSLLLSELLDLDPASNFTFAKLRASYGLVGLGSPFTYGTSTPFVSATTADGWTDGVIFPFNGLAAFTRSDVLGNPNLRPEFRGSFEAGADLRFFNGRVGLDVSYYSSKSRDIILQVPVAGSSGYQAAILNAASMSNKGIEAVLNLTPVQSRDFRWDATLNFTRNTNNVDQLADGVDQVFLGGFTGASTRAVVGYPYGTVFGFGFYYDADGNRVIGDDGYPVLDPNERAFASALPDFQIGLRNTFSWKGLTLSALLDIKQGGYLWNGTKSALYFFGTHGDIAELNGTNTVFEGNVAVYEGGDIKLYDHDNNPVTPDIPQTGSANTQSVPLNEGWLRLGNANGFFGDNTEDFVEDASWVRLRDISLNYSLPTSVLGSRFKSISLGVSARNLWLSTPYTGVDPETNLYGASNAQGLDYFNMPNTKGFTFNLRVGF